MGSMANKSTESSCSNDLDFEPKMGVKGITFKKSFCANLMLPELADVREHVCQNNKDVMDACPVTCGSCCEDNEYFYKWEKKKPYEMPCTWLKDGINKYLCNYSSALTRCPKTCNNCLETPYPTTADPTTADPTAEPTGDPTANPTNEPTTIPTSVESEEPTSVDTEEPTSVGTEEPTSVDVEEPTSVATEEPSSLKFTDGPSDDPTSVDVDEPTSVETEEPTSVDVEEPTSVDTEEPTMKLCSRSQQCDGVLVFFGKTPDCLLPKCAGHCNENSDCASDLICFKGGSTETNDSIPGCETVPYENINYCIAKDLSAAPTELPPTKPTILPTVSPSHRPAEGPIVSPTLTKTPTACNSGWKQIGEVIDITDAHFAMAPDELVVAVRKRQSIHLFEYTTSGSWELIADAIDPEFTTEGDNLHKLALSSDGSVVAISDQYYNTRRGRVMVFARDSKNGWTKLGRNIDGENQYDESGYSLAISADGTTVVIGAIRNGTDPNRFAGHVRVYTYFTCTQSWIQIGSDIDGEARSDYSGHSVAASRDGSIIAIGAPRNDGANGDRENSGHVRVYGYDIERKNWIQRGKNIDGEAEEDRSGFSIAMSADGQTVAIGSQFNSGNGQYWSGHVRVYDFDKDEVTWFQRGKDIYGEDEKDESGSSVAMSADGKTIAIGAPFNDETNKNAGHVRLYGYNTDGWVKQGEDLDGDNENDNFGEDVSISAGGSVVGASGGGTKKLKISELTTCGATLPSSMPSVTPTCAGGKTFQLDITTDRFPHQTTWDVKNSEGGTVLSGGPYDELFTSYSESHCLNSGCYTFTIRDTGRDGLCCDWFAGEGEYKLLFNSLKVKEGGEFESEESIVFGDVCSSSALSAGCPVCSCDK